MRELSDILFSTMDTSQQKHQAKHHKVPSNLLAQVLQDVVNDEREFGHRHKLMFSFFQGLLYGVGFIFAVAIAVPLTILLLQQIEWVPIIGKFIGDLAEWLTSNAGLSGGAR